MSVEDDADRFHKLITNGWEDEECRKMLLTESQVVLLSEDFASHMQEILGLSASIVLSVNEHVTVLSDNTVIIEGSGRVE